MDAALPEDPERAPPAAAPEAEEVDVWWGGYSGRTMVPEFALSGLVTAGIVGLAWYLGAWRDSSWLRSAMPILLGAYWLLLVARWLYRPLSANYRLTTRRLFCEQGFGHPGRPGVELSQVAEVAVEQTLLERLTSVGRIRIELQDRATPPLVLAGVSKPEQIAKLIRRQIRHDRESE
jgi:hypothetical protein